MCRRAIGNNENFHLIDEILLNLESFKAIEDCPQAVFRTWIVAKYNEVWSEVKTNGYLSESSNIMRSLRQGCLLFCTYWLWRHHSWCQRFWTTHEGCGIFVIAYTCLYIFTVLLSDTKFIEIIDSVLRESEAVTGAKFNKGMSLDLPLNT